MLPELKVFSHSYKYASFFPYNFYNLVFQSRVGQTSKFGIMSVLRTQIRVSFIVSELIINNIKLLCFICKHNLVSPNGSQLGILCNSKLATKNFPQFSLHYYHFDLPYPHPLRVNITALLPYRASTGEKASFILPPHYV
jgi:hypothetical protein